MDELIQISEKIGQRIPAWTQGAGGNVSVKNKGILTIKASGVRLGSMRSGNSLAQVQIGKTTDALLSINVSDPQAEKRYSEILSGNPKPSMETGMHLFLLKKWVFHFHSLVALLMAHERENDPKQFECWLKENTSQRITFIEPVRPGLFLSQHVKAAELSSIYILENHGVLIQSDDTSIVDEWAKLELSFEKSFGYTGLHKPLVEKPIPWRFYFPDSAVFADRLKNIVVEVKQSTSGSEPFFELKPQAQHVDRDAFEIWSATMILYQACPKLKELPVHIASTLADLPTEQYRRGLK